jgi:hypothetical protein
VRTPDAVASRNESQNTPTLSTSAIAAATARASTPPSRCPAPPDSPDSTSVASSQGPTIAIRPTLRSSDRPNAGRRWNGTAQALFSAFWVAAARPRAPNRVPASPIASAGPVELSACTLLFSCGPITG